MSRCVCHIEDGLVQEWVAKARAVAQAKGLLPITPRGWANGIISKTIAPEEVPLDLRDAVQVELLNVGRRP